MHNKSTILMLPSWYPTKDFPLQGTFFREQAFALQEKYNFIVLRINEKKSLWPLYYFKKILGITKPKLKFVQDDYGLLEYSLVICKPVYVFLEELKFNLRRYFKKNIRQGVGKIELNSIKKARLNSILRLKKKNALPSFNVVYSLTSPSVAISFH